MMPKPADRTRRRALIAGLACLVVLATGGEAAAETLEAALARAYENNPTLLAERARLRATDEAVPLARAGARPTFRIDGNIGVSETDTTTTSLGRTSESSASLTPRNYDIVVSNSLYQGGRVDAETASAEHLVRAGRAGLLSVEQAIMLDAATAYLDVLSDRAVLDLNRNNERVVSRQLQAAQDRFRVGEVTRTDISQAEARLAQAKADRIAAEGRLVTTNGNYRRTTGAPPGDLSWPPMPRDMPESEEAALALAETESPGILAAEFTSAAARADIRAAQSSLYPRVSLQGSYGTYYDQTEATEERSAATLNVNVSIPLYQSGAERSRVRRAKQVAAQRRFEADQARREARLDITSAWEALETARARIAAIESQVEAASIALEGVTQEAFVGLRTTLDVLDAEQELFRANVDLVRAQRDEIVSAYRLQAATGNLTAQKLGLAVDPYDDEAYYNRVRDEWFEPSE